MTNSPDEPRDPRYGTVQRECREGDRIRLSLDGDAIGFIEVRHVPGDRKVKLAIRLDRRIRIDRIDP